MAPQPDGGMMITGRLTLFLPPTYSTNGVHLRDLYSGCWIQPVQMRYAIDNRRGRQKRVTELLSANFEPKPRQGDLFS